jgi:hypothetical protein
VQLGRDLSFEFEASEQKRAFFVCRSPSSKFESSVTPGSVLTCHRIPENEICGVAVNQEVSSYITAKVLNPCFRRFAMIHTVYKTR